jgi:hypothetical protein
VEDRPTVPGRPPGAVLPVRKPDRPPPRMPIHFPVSMSHMPSNSPSAAATRPALRPIGGVPLLLVVALAVATPAMGVQSVLADLGAVAPGAAERTGLRLISGTIARLVRGVTGRRSTERPVRPEPAWVHRPASDEPPTGLTVAPETGPAHGLVRVALLDLPPPLC